jgi:DNA invertase Pin-like site-specific DNA recombinase
MIGTQDDEIVRRYKRGETIRTIADRLGINRDTVGGHLRRQGVSARRRPLTPAQVDQAVEEYRHGKSVAVIGTELGVDGTTVWRALRRVGVPLRDAHGRDHETPRPE